MDKKNADGETRTRNDLLPFLFSHLSPEGSHLPRGDRSEKLNLTAVVPLQAGSRISQIAFRPDHPSLDITLQQHCFIIKMASKTVVAFDLYGTLLATDSIANQLATYFGATKAQAISALWRRYQLEYTWRLNSMGKDHQPALYGRSN